MTIEDRVAADIRRTMADAASRFAFDHGLGLVAEAQLHMLLKDAACSGMAGASKIVKHRMKRNHE